MQIVNHKFAGNLDVIHQKVTTKQLVDCDVFQATNFEENISCLTLLAYLAELLS